MSCLIPLSELTRVFVGLTRHPHGPQCRYITSICARPREDLLGRHRWRRGATKPLGELGQEPAAGRRRTSEYKARKIKQVLIWNTYCWPAMSFGE